MKERQEGKIMGKRKQIQQLTLAAFFVAVEIIMWLTPIGYIPFGAINITTMHLPVILAGMTMGPAYGALMGFVFGMTSLIRATFQPGVTSFIFSPFITVGGIHGNFWSLLIAWGPRILLGWLSGQMFRFLKKKMQNQHLAAAVTAACNTMIHTLLVMGMIWVFFGDPYAQALGLSKAAAGAAVIGVITSNGILETILAAVVIPVLIKALGPSIERMGLNG